jgi:hypothetical protein
MENTNASGWKVHLSTSHRIYPDNSSLTPSPGGKLMIQSQVQSMRMLLLTLLIIIIMHYEKPAKENQPTQYRAEKTLE